MTTNPSTPTPATTRRRTPINPKHATRPELIAACRKLNINPTGGLSSARKADLITWVEMNQTPDGKPLVVGRRGPDAHGRVHLTTTTDYKIVMHYETDPKLGDRARIYIDHTVTDARSTALAHLDRQESELGERRFAQRGHFPEVDDLYDRLNAEIARVNLDIAGEALRLVAGQPEVTGDIDRAIDGAEYSRYAGCDCPCSPGVVAGALVKFQSAALSMWVTKLDD